MSTIIKAKPLRHWVGGAALALSAWATIILAMPFAGPAGRPVAVVGDKVAAIAAIQAAGGQILGTGEIPGNLERSLLQHSVVEARHHCLLPRSSLS